MIEAGFYIEKEIPRKWWVMLYCGVDTPEDIEKVFGAILSAGAGRNRAEIAADELSKINSGYIFTNGERRFSLIAMSRATNYAQLFNTVAHEINHLTAHICERFGYDTDGEKAAYIQGEIGQKMYPVIAEAICPKCNCGKSHVEFLH